MQDPWTLYWQADRLDSADAVQSTTDYAPIKAWWCELALQLNTGSGVLDLATGNGTVPASLLDANADLNITAVDRADIDPLRYLADPGPLQTVRFQGQVDICSLPFDDESFDAVTSQFGIEYAPQDAAIVEAARVLKHGGQLQFLLHCDDSEIVQPARRRRAEMTALLAEDSVLPCLRSFIAGERDETELESVGKTHLAAARDHTQGITGQIYTGVNQVVGFVKQGDRRAAAELCETMVLRLTADRDRLLALEGAAMDEAGFEAFIGKIAAAGVSVDVASALSANEGADDEFKIGWKYRGRKA
jgi:ubiquinone/menaquinone biosynthesis C-methylase UbiE